MGAIVIFFGRKDNTFSVSALVKQLIFYAFSRTERETVFQQHVTALSEHDGLIYWLRCPCTQKWCKQALQSIVKIRGLKMMNEKEFVPTRNCVMVFLSENSFPS